MMRNRMRHQGGIGLTGMLFFLALAIFFVTVALKLGPHYMEYLEVRSVMRSLTEDSSLAEGGKSGIVKAIGNRLTINYIEGVDTKDFKIKRVKNGYQVGVKYDVREHLFANVDVLLTFQYEVQVGEK